MRKVEDWCKTNHVPHIVIIDEPIRAGYVRLRKWNVTQ